MKNSVFIMLTAITLGSSLTGCDDNSKTKNIEDKETVIKENSNEDSEIDRENIERLEKGIMLTGESVKGGNYLITVHKGYSEKIILEDKNQTIHNVVVPLSVKNVRDDAEAIDITELIYELHDKNNKTFNGKVVAELKPVKPGETINISAFFEVTSVDDSYEFFVENKIDPIESHWIIDNLNTSL